MLGRGWVRPTKFTSNWKCSAHGTFREKIHSGTETWLEWVTLGESLCGAVVCRNKWTRVSNKGLYSSWDKVTKLSFVPCAIFLASQHTKPLLLVLYYRTSGRQSRIGMSLWKRASLLVSGLGPIICHLWLSFAYHVATSHAKWVALSVNCNCIFPLIHQKLATVHQYT